MTDLEVGNGWLSPSEVHQRDHQGPPPCSFGSLLPQDLVLQLLAGDSKYASIIMRTYYRNSPPSLPSKLWTMIQVPIDEPLSTLASNWLLPVIHPRDLELGTHPIRRSRTKLMLVCRTWHELIIRTPTFWSRIVSEELYSDAGICEWKRRFKLSVKSPLHLYLQGRGRLSKEGRPVVSVALFASPDIWVRIEFLYMDNSGGI